MSYYAQVSDNNRFGGQQTATTDIYFFEIRPFGRNYRQADQGGGGQQTNVQINLDIGAEEDRIAIEQARANMAKAEAFVPPPAL